MIVKGLGFMGSFDTISGLLILWASAAFGRDLGMIPVRGLHVIAPKPGEMADCLRFVREALPKEGVNVLVIEFNYRFVRAYFGARLVDRKPWKRSSASGPFSKKCEKQA